jgi:hypothetical protein
MTQHKKNQQVQYDLQGLMSAVRMEQIRPHPDLRQKCHCRFLGNGRALHRNWAARVMKEH